MTGVYPAEPLRTDELEFDLPHELIAQTPLPVRHDSRLMVLARAGGPVLHRHIRDLPDLLRAGDLIVANNSRVLPARLTASKIRTGGRVELLLLERQDGPVWTALARPVRRLRAGTKLVVHPRVGIGGPDERAVIEEVGLEGMVRLRLSPGLDTNLTDYGQMPLPPYIHERLDDAERYQTVYARRLGSAAAPTAGLHITEELLERLRAAGIGWAEVTLHVGLDTFKPISTELVLDHHIHREWCSVSDETARAINESRSAGGRVIALGTTSARTLETVGNHQRDGQLSGWSGPTGLFIMPGYRWQVVDRLITNFHLPRSSLLAMVSALVGWNRLKAAYEEAIAQRYRFFSFGDAMLIA
jgi:S-adenosylmethionine:tRNA ribosyltransferase-isomerase